MRPPLSLEEKLWRHENDPAWKTINLPVDGRSDMVEEVLVEQIGDNHYRIASSPGMVQGLAANDVIALDSQTVLGYKLLERGGNVCVHLLCDATQRNEIQETLTRELAPLGGNLDGTMGETGLCFTIPVAAGFTAIEGAFQRVVSDEWFFSNVYDPETHAPLNWWFEQPEAAAEQ